MNRRYAHKDRLFVQSLAIVSLLALTACGGGGGGSDDPSAAIDISAMSKATAVTAVAAGSVTCPNGGYAVTTGTTTQYACHGSNGQNALVNAVPVPVGSSQCPNGGIKIEIGLDGNRNGVLDPKEVTTTRYVCNGRNGTNGTNGAAGANGLNSLITLTAEPAGLNCPAGGNKVVSGLDGNRNGILDASEVTNTSYICSGANGSNGTDGTDGQDGTSALITSVDLPAGDGHCAYGGTEVVSGADTDSSGLLLNPDGSLNTTNVTKVSYVCHGAPGANGSNGTNGTNGINGVGALIDSIALASGDAHCTYGGTEIVTGLNQDGTGVLVNADGSLNAANAVNATYVCNGNPGAGGMAWLNLTGITTAQMAPNAGYIAANDDAAITLTLPANPAVGDVVRIKGAGRGGWTIAQNAGQFIDIVGLPKYRTLAGREWTRVDLPPADWSAVASSADGLLLAAAVDGRGIYHSTDGGATWEEANVPTQPWSSIVSSADGSHHAAVTTNGEIWTSTSGAGGWLRRSFPIYAATWGGIAMSADGLHLAAIGGGELLVSQDSGMHWLYVRPPASGDLAAVALSSDGQSLVVGLRSANEVYLSIDGGATWTMHRVTGAADLRSLAASADVRHLAVLDASHNMFASHDGGVTWARTSAPPLQWGTIAMARDGSRLLAAAPGSLGGIYVSRDFGASWTKGTLATGGSNPNWLSAACSAACDRLFAGSSQGLYLSNDVMSWNAQTTAGTAGNLSGGMFDALELVYLGAGRFGILSFVGSAFLAR